jgi:ACS family glucarate transporter-like MFS transporter
MSYCPRDKYKRHAAASRRTNERRTHVRVAVVALLCVLSFLTYYDRVCIVRAQESIQESLGISDQQMGLVFGAFWLAYAIFEIPGGWMGDRMGARFTLTRILLAWSLFTALTGAATGFYSLLMYRFLFGVGEAGAYPNMAHVQSRWLPKIERARAGGAVWFCARCGAAFAPLSFGTITRSVDWLRACMPVAPSLTWLESIPSWRFAFFLSGALGAVWCLVFYPWFRDDPAQKRSVSSSELRHIEVGRGNVETEHQMERRIWGQLVSSPSLWAMALYYICGSFGWSFFVSWMPRYLKEVHGVTFEESEWTSVWPLLFGGLACLVGGVLSDELVKRTGWRRLGRAVFPVIGCLIAAAAMLAIPHVGTQRDATILMCVAAAAFDFGQAANWAAIVDMGGRYAGIALGFINMVGNLGNAAQPYVGAKVFSAFGWDRLFHVYALAFILAMLMWAVINPLRVFYSHRE